MDEYTERMNAEADADYERERLDAAREEGARYAARKIIDAIVDYGLKQNDPVRLQAIRDLMVWLTKRDG